MKAAIYVLQIFICNSLRNQAQTIKYHVQINLHPARNLNPICGLSDRRMDEQISRANFTKRLNNLVAVVGLYDTAPDLHTAF